MKSEEETEERHSNLSTQHFLPSDLQIQAFPGPMVRWQEVMVAFGRGDSFDVSTENDSVSNTGFKLSYCRAYWVQDVQTDKWYLDVLLTCQLIWNYV